jgi:hypothetical protein
VSDADNQTGGDGSKTGKHPGEGDDEAPNPVSANTGKPTGEDQAEENEDDSSPGEQSEQADQESVESFPASDPPANY